MFSITTVHKKSAEKINPERISFRRIFFFIRIRKKNTLQCLTQNSTNNNLFELSEMFHLFKDSLSFPLIMSLWLRSKGFVWLVD